MSILQEDRRGLIARHRSISTDGEDGGPSSERSRTGLFILISTRLGRDARYCNCSVRPAVAAVTRRGHPSSKEDSS